MKDLQMAPQEHLLLPLAAPEVVVLSTSENKKEQVYRKKSITEQKQDKQKNHNLQEFDEL